MNKMVTLERLIQMLPADARAITPFAAKLRRHFHQFPEVGNQEFKTTARLKRELAKLGLTIFDGRTPTGLWAELDTGRAGTVVAVRTDIDALPITENTGLPYASKHPGVMHACGHDVHMAILIGTARLLTKYRSSLAGRVKFICQPAEEVPPGGAGPLIEAGVLDRPHVDVILALHVDPSLPTGALGVRDGATMGSTYDFDLRITGRAGHAAFPHQGVDAIAVAAEVITGLQQIVSRMIDPMEPAVITFGTIHGGQVRNSLATAVTLQGTARSLNHRLTKRLPRMIRQTAVKIGQAFGADVEVISLAEYPVLKSDPRTNRFIVDTHRALYPDGHVHQVPAVMGAEDFACYLKQVPGAMFRLGVRNEAIGADKPWHHPAYIIDEDAIPIGIATMAGTIINLLAKWHGGRP